MKRPHRFLNLAITFALLVMIGASDTIAQNFDLQFSDMFPSDHPFASLSAEWAAEVTRRTGGVVRVTVHPGGSLTSPGECLAGVLSGVGQICHSALAYTPHRFPVMEAADFPGYPAAGNTARLTSLVANELYRAFQPAEFEGLHVLYLHAHPPGAFTTVERPLMRVADLSELKIRSTGLSARIALHLDAEPVLRPATQSYELLATHAVDATMTPLESLEYLGFGEVTKYTALAPELGYVTTFALAISENTWRQLPTEARQIITEVSEEFRERAAALWDEISLEGYRHALEKGHEFTVLPDDEVQSRSEEVLETLEQEYLIRLNAMGIDGSDILRLRRQIIDDHANSFTPILDIDEAAISALANPYRLPNGAVLGQSGRYVNANGVRMYYEVHGEGPPLLLIHGDYAVMETWIDTVPDLMRHFTVILPELRGHGRSEDGDAPFTFELFADDMVAFLDALEIDRAVVIGHSGGASTALMMALKYPERVQKWVGISTWFNAAGSTYEFARDSAGSLAPGWITAEALERWRMINPMGPDYLPTYLQKMKGLAKHPTLTPRDLGEITVPTLLIAGDRDWMRLDHTGTLFESLGRNPDSEFDLAHRQLAIIPGAGHMVPNEKPVLVNEIILSFLLER